MTTHASALAEALACHRGGDLAGAEHWYRQALGADAAQADTWHYLGMACLAQGKFDQAAASLSESLRLRPGQADVLNNLGIALAQWGRPDEAVARLREAIRSRPDHAGAWNNLGLVLMRQGRASEALTHYERALEIQPDYAEAHNNRGNCLRSLGRPQEAAAAYDQALRAAPQYAEAHYNLANLLADQGQADEAIARYRNVLAMRPGYAEAHNNLGNVLRDLGRLDEADACYRQALRHKPDFAEAYHNLGNIFRARQQLSEAASHYQQALRLRSHFVEARTELAGTLFAQARARKEAGQPDEAFALYQQVLQLQPDNAEAHNNLANIHKAQGRPAQAAASYGQALRLRPDYVEALHNLGTVLQQLGKLDEAVACFEQALRMKPDQVESRYALGMAFRDCGRTDEALTHLEEALRIYPDDRLRLTIATMLPPIYQSMADLAQWRQRLLDNIARLHAEHFRYDLTAQEAPNPFFLAYQGLDDRPLVADLARFYAAPPDEKEDRTPKTRVLSSFSPDEKEDRTPKTRVLSSFSSAAAGAGGPSRIKVGFISRFLRDHTIGHLNRGLIASLDRKHFAATVLAAGPEDDAVGQMIRQQADAAVRLPLDLPKARQLVAEQGLDVLLYTDIGMDPFTYSLAYSRLAPVQCATWGHPDTTGIPTIDYFLSAENLETDGADDRYTETLVRFKTLPVYYYRPERPTPGKGRTDFGLPPDAHLYMCLQTTVKIHPEFDDLLARILRGDPQGLLILLQAPFYRMDELLRQRLATTLPDVLDRVRWLPRQSATDFVSLNAVADVLLDPIHFGGGKTSYEGLAMGVPIVTLPSAFLRGRITYALYRQMGVLDCVARTADEYVALALRLGTDPGYRTAVATKIREASGLLFENPPGVRELEEFWQRAVKQRKQD
jgi:predicted O-linked N-acetylglucosamine transferase (SPINDLY family)